VAKQPERPEDLARRFCHALTEETAGMTPGAWRVVDTIAKRMGVSFDEASAIADDCVRRGWVEHVVMVHTVRLLEDGARSASRGEIDDHPEG